MTGKFLTQGLRAPNYVYEPLSVFREDIKKLTTQIGLKQTSAYLAEKFRDELMNILLTGRPNKDSLHKNLAKSGINVASGGDVITKTIRLRYENLKGWVEEQESFKVNLRNIFRWHNFWTSLCILIPELVRLINIHLSKTI